MNRLIIQTVLALSLAPLAVAQSTPPSGTPESSSIDRARAIKNAQTICIESNTVFLTVSTMDRALMKQKNWDRLGLNILAGCSADLRLEIDRVHFTHIHTYVLTDRGSGIVLSAGRIRALDGVIASGPMAEQIVKILSAVRQPVSSPAARDDL